MGRWLGAEGRISPISLQVSLQLDSSGKEERLKSKGSSSPIRREEDIRERRYKSKVKRMRGGVLFTPPAAIGPDKSVADDDTVDEDSKRPMLDEGFLVAGLSSEEKRATAALEPALGKS